MPKNPTVVFLKPGKVIIEERGNSSLTSCQLLIKSICSLINPGTELTIPSGVFPEDSAWVCFPLLPVIAM